MCLHCYRAKEAENNEAHIYNVIDEGHAYEVVTKDSGFKTNQKKLPSATGKVKQEFDLKPCPAYMPVTTQATEAQADTLYEIVSST